MTLVLPDVRLAMNNDQFQRMLDVLRGAKLTHHEREMIRSELQTYMRAHPAKAPFLLRALDVVTFTMRASVLRPRFQFAALSLFLVFALGAGTSYAAEGALPGNPLYAVKIHVNEQIEGAFAVSPQAKAQWNAQLAARRLQEAEELASQNKLNAAASATLAAGLNEATNNFDTSVAALASSTADVATATDLQSSMEATLAVHAQVLTEIAEADPQVHVAVKPILSSVESKVAAITGAQASLTARVAANTDVAQKIAEAQRDVALGQLGQAQALIRATAHVDAAAGTSTTDDPDTLAAQTAIEEGEQHLAQGNYGAAMETFQAANLAAQEAKVRAYVQNEIHITPGVVLPTTTVPIGIIATTSASSSLPIVQIGATTTIEASGTATSAPEMATSSQATTSALEHGRLELNLGL